MNSKTKIFAFLLWIALSNASYPQQVTTVSILPISIDPERLDPRSAYLYSEYIAARISVLGGDKLRVVSPGKCMSILLGSALASEAQFTDQRIKTYPQKILSSSLGGDLIVYGFSNDPDKNEFSVTFLDPRTLQEKVYVFDAGNDWNLESQGNRISSFIYSKISPFLGKSKASVVTLQFQGGMTWYPPSYANVSVYLIPVSGAFDIKLSDWFGMRLGFARYWSRGVVEKKVDNLAPDDALLSTTTFFGAKGGVFIDLSIIRVYTDLDMSLPFMERPNDLLPYWFLNGGFQVKIFGNLYLGGGLTFYKQRDITTVSVSNSTYTYKISQLGWIYFPTFNIGIGL
jgi:hypothetical protein